MKPIDQPKPNRVLLFLVGTSIVLLAISLLAVIVGRQRDHDALELELKLARDEGIPTTWAEFAAGITKSPPDENSADFYRDLMRRKLKRPDDKLSARLAIRPTRATIAEAAKWVQDHQGDYQILEQATNRRFCWFDRDWSKGVVVLMPELASMKSCSYLLAFRSSLEAVQNQDQKAVEDLHRAMKVADHVGQETTMLSALVRQACYNIALSKFALLCYQYPTHTIYQREMEQAIKNYPIPNMLLIHRDKCLVVRSIIEMCRTPEGRKELGLKEDDQSNLEHVIPLVVSQHKADIEIVKACRQMYEACLLPAKDRAHPYEDAKDRLYKSLIAYPTACDIYSKWVEEDSVEAILDQAAQSVQIKYAATLQFLKSTRNKGPFKVTGLKSPFDGSPVKCSYDGKQIDVAVDGGSTENASRDLKIPGDTVFKALTK